MQKLSCLFYQYILLNNDFCIQFSAKEHFHGVQRWVVSVDNFFPKFEIIILCCVVAICDLVHDVETIFHHSYVLTASGNLF